jgi:class 3 adenylate cyclase
MAEAQQERRLLGYTALTERDEAAAVRTRERQLEIVQTLVKQFEGEVVDTAGDEALSILPKRRRSNRCEPTT